MSATHGDSACPFPVELDAAHAPAGAWSAHAHALVTWQASSCNVEGYELRASGVPGTILVGPSVLSAHVSLPDGERAIEVRARYTFTPWCWAFDGYCNVPQHRWGHWNAAPPALVDTRPPIALVERLEGARVLVDGETVFTESPRAWIGGSDEGSGIALAQARLAGGEWGDARPFVPDEEGRFRVEYRVSDRAGFSASGSIALARDTRAPEIAPIELHGPVARVGADTFVSEATTATLRAWDAVTGVASHEAVFDEDGPRALEGAVSFAGLADGAHVLRETAVDRVGWVAQRDTTVRVDTTPPSLLVEGRGPTGARVAFLEAGPCLARSPAALPEEIAARDDRDDPLACTGASVASPAVGADAREILQPLTPPVLWPSLAAALDALGFEGPVEAPVVEATYAPVLVATGDVTFRIASKDAGAGVARVVVRVDGVESEARPTRAGNEFAWTLRAGELAAGEHALVFESRDLLGHRASVAWRLVTVPDGKSGLDATARRALESVPDAPDVPGAGLPVPVPPPPPPLPPV